MSEKQIKALENIKNYIKIEGMTGGDNLCVEAVEELNAIDFSIKSIKENKELSEKVNVQLDIIADRTRDVIFYDKQNEQLQQRIATLESEKKNDEEWYKDKIF